MSWSCTVDRRMCRLGAMLCLTLMFFLVELIYGHIINSLALISDSYHMLSDVVAMVIAMVSIRISKIQSPKNTYGWIRAEVLGALVNSVFLLALCFAIIVEAIQRLTTGEAIVNDPDSLLYIGIVGLIFNLIALALFHRAGHGHSHGGDAGRSHSPRVAQRSSGQRNGESTDDNAETEIENTPASRDDVEAGTGSGQADRERRNADLHEQLTMRAVFLHVLGDAVSSVNVIVSALLIKFVEDDSDWKHMIDPIARQPLF